MTRYIMQILLIINGNVENNFYSDEYVIGYGKTAHFAHYFKIELLVFKGSVDLKQ